MAVLEKKNTLIKTITFMAFFAAINVVLSLVSNFVPFFTVLLVIVLPLTSAVVEISCEDKFYPIYALATIGLSFAVSFWNIDFSIFYLIPSLVTGFLFGFMSKRNLPPIWSIFLSAISQGVLTYISLALTDLVLTTTILEKLSILFGEYLFSILFAISLAQIILSYIVVFNELKKLGVSKGNIFEINKVFSYVNFGVVGASIPLVFLHKGASYLLAVISFFFAIIFVCNFVQNKFYKKLIVSLVIIFVNLFVFAIFNPIIAFGQILLFEFSSLSIGVISLLNF